MNSQQFTLTIAKHFSNPKNHDREIDGILIATGGRKSLNSHRTFVNVKKQNRFSDPEPTNEINLFLDEITTGRWQIVGITNDFVNCNHQFVRRPNGRHRAIRHCGTVRTKDKSFMSHNIIVIALNSLVK